MWYGHFFGGMMMMLVWPALIVLLIFFMFRGFKHHEVGRTQRAPGSTEKALEVLNERYSKGEIDDDEYLRRKKNLFNN